MKNINWLLLILFLHALCAVSVQGQDPITCEVLFTSDVSCNGAQDGEIILEATGGVGSPYYFDYGSGQMEGHFIDLAGGIYSVTVTDDAGNESVCEEITIIEPEALECGTVIATDITCTGLNDGIIELIPSGGTPPYFFDNNIITNTTGIFENLSQGSYSIQITDALDCFVYCFHIPIANPPNLQCSILSSTDVSCNGISDGSLSVEATGGTGAYFFTDGTTTNTTGVFNNLSSGLYNITITDENDCETNCLPVQINEADELQCGNIEITEISCFNGNDGVITVVPSGGTPPFNFSNILTSNTTGVFDNLATGSYPIIITDANDCQIICGPYLLYNPPNLDYEIVNLTSSCANEDTGIIEILATQGTAPYTYSLGNISNTTGLFTGLASGGYSISIVDANGCSTVTGTIGLGGNATLLCGFPNVQHVSCSGGEDGSVLVEGFGGTQPYTFTLGLDTNATGEFTNLSAGQYTILISDANGCETECASFTIAEPEVLECIFQSSEDVSCYLGNDGSLSVLAQGGTAPYTYTDGITTNTTGVFTNLGSGSYFIAITDANLCEKQCDSIVINQPKELVCGNADISEINCHDGNDGAIVLTPQGGTAPYNYDNGIETNGTGIFDDLSAGSYMITVTDANNCAIECGPYDLANPTILEYDLLSVNSVSCANADDGSISLLGSGGTGPGTYTYELNGVTNNTGIFANLVAGSYTIIITDANNCEIGTAEIEVGSAEQLSCNVEETNNVSCFGLSNGNISVSGSGGTAPYTYELNGVANTTGVFSGLSANTYTIQISDINGCIVECTSVDVSEPELLECLFQTSEDASCYLGNDGSLTVLAQGGKAPYSYTDGVTTNTTGIFTNLGSASYFITITDANLCETVCNPVIINQPEELVCGSADIIGINCHDGSDGVTILTPEGGTAPYSFDNGNVTNGTGIFTGLSSATYVITVTDANNCAIECGPYDVENPALLEYNLIGVNNVACAGGDDGSIELIGSGGTVPYTYQLNGVTNTSGLFTDLVAGSHTIIITDANDCIIETAEIEVGSAEQLFCNIEEANDVSCFGLSDGNITVSSIGGTAPYTYDLNGITNTTGVFTDLPAGDFIIIITDANACITECAQVFITQPTELTCSAINSTNTSCGENNGTIEVAAVGGTAPFEYTIGGLPNGTGIFTGLSAGNYVVVINDANNCQVSCEEIEITNPAMLQCNILQSTDVSCFGGTNGSILIEGIGGTAPYTYTNGVVTNTTGEFAGLTSDIYSITVTDATGCEAICGGVIVGSPELLTCGSINTTNISCAGLADGLINIAAAGGTAPYDYSLDNTSNSTGLFQGLSVGVYTVFITDANDCFVECSSIEITEPDLFSCELLEAQNVSCYGGDNGFIKLEAFGGTAPYSFTLGSDANSIGVFDDLPAGEYAPIISDANGCQVECDIIEIEEPLNLSCELFSSSDAECGQDNGTILVTANGGIAPYSYSIGSDMNLDGEFVGLSEGIYIIVITDANNCVTNCISVEIESLLGAEDMYEDIIYCDGEQPDGIETSGTYIFPQVDENNCPFSLIQDITLVEQENISIDTTICHGDVFEIFGLEFPEEGYYEVNIDPCESLLALDITYAEQVELFVEDYLCDGNEIIVADSLITESGLYMDTIPSPTCDTIVFYEIFQSLNTEISFYGETNICNDGAVSLSVDGYETYLWSDGSVTQEIMIAEPGDISIMVQDSFGCAFTDTITITETVFPLLNFLEGTEPTTCDSNDGSFSFISSEDLEGFIFSINNGLDWQASTVFENIGFGQYDVSIATADTMCMKPSATTFQFYNPGAPVIADIEVINGCLIGTSTIIINLVNPDIENEFEIVYSLDGINYSDSNIFENVEEGSYEFRVMNLDQDCEYIYPVLVEVISLESMEIDAITLSPSCLGNSDGNIELFIDNGELIDSVVWNDDELGYLRNDLTAGEYTTNVYAFDNCVRTIQINVDEGEEFIIEMDWLIDQTICPDDTITLAGKPGLEGQDWYGPDGEFLSSELEIQVTTAGTYILESYDESNCIATNSVTIYIEESDFEGLIFLLSTEGLVNAPIIATDFSNPKFENVVWVYDRELITHLSSEQNHEVIMFDTPGVYSVGMQAAKGNCTKTIWKEITIYENEEELSNPSNHIGLDGFINEFKITPTLNTGTWRATMAIRGNNDISLFVVSEAGYIVDQRNLNIKDVHMENYEMNDLPPGIYSMILMTPQDWRYINFTKI